MTEAPALRPLRVGEILDVAIKIVWRNARTLVAAVLVVAAPVQLLALTIALSTAPEHSRLTVNDVGGGAPTVTSDESSSAFVTGQLLVVGLAVVLTTLATAVCFKAIGDAYLGRRPSWKASLRYVMRRAHSVIWVTVLTWVGLVFALIALIVPGVWLWCAWSVAVPALLLEDCRGRHALGRSFRLVKGRWWPTFAAITVGYLLAWVVGTIVQGLVIAPFFATDATDTAGIVANGVATTAGVLITTPFQAAVVAVIYFDLRVRKEGFDLQLLAERLGLPAPEGATLALPAERPAPAEGEEQPPYWPPPPGWRPQSATDD